MINQDDSPTARTGDTQPAGDTKPDYARFDTNAGFQAAVDRLLALKGRELRIFDPDMTAFRLNSPARIELLRAFLAASRVNRIYIVVHDPEPLTRSTPRMMNLLALYNHAIRIQRTSEEIRGLQDSFALLDRNHYLRRPVAHFFRGSIGINDESEALGLRSRFEEIWNASYPSVSSTTSGL